MTNCWNGQKSTGDGGWKKRRIQKLLLTLSDSIVSNWVLVANVHVWNHFVCIYECVCVHSMFMYPFDLYNFIFCFFFHSLTLSLYTFAGSISRSTTGNYNWYKCINVEDGTTPHSKSSTSSCQSFLNRKKKTNQTKNIHHTSRLHVKWNRLKFIEIARAILSFSVNVCVCSSHKSKQNFQK